VLLVQKLIFLETETLIDTKKDTKDKSQSKIVREPQ